jgi:hypothetical protein
MEPKFVRMLKPLDEREVDAAEIPARLLSRSTSL